MLLTSPQQVVVMEFVKRHDTTDTTDFCPRQLVADLLWGSDRETGVMDFGKTCDGKVANLLRTCYGETSVMDFGRNGTDTALHRTYSCKK